MFVTLFGANRSLCFILKIENLTLKVPTNISKMISLLKVFCSQESEENGIS